MSDLGFDPRPYCERLVKPGDRFTFYCKDGLWILTDTGSVIDDDDGTGPYNAQFWSTEGVREAWRFFGPLADERKIDPLALYKSYDKRKQSAFYRATRDERTKWHERDFTNELLESIVAAVVESFESEVKG